MRTHILGRTGLEVSVVGFGGIPLQGNSRDEAARIVERAVETGITFFDSARGYTDSEEKLGLVLSRHRARVVIATKSLARDKGDMARDIITSLGLLRTDVIDLYQAHSVGTQADLDRVLGPGGAYEALDAARRAGKVRFIGITGHSRPVLQRAVETGLFDTVQHPFNFLETDWLTDVIPAARRIGLGVIGMKPVAGGALSRVAAASVRFAISRGVDVAIPGMDAMAQVDENARAGADAGELRPDELSALEAEKERWGGAFCHRCGYCTPCPNGLNIPFLFLIEAYYTRYELRDWALARLAGLGRKYADCAACGECLAKCPYGLPIPDLMAKAASAVR
ncbi:MAG: aldo/keto reductase [Deltaproteobacteria bacterium]|nr:aldo/keto reductase [Deltaproteobacteria bacterium]